jgi:hypothetical protein
MTVDHLTLEAHGAECFRRAFDAKDLNAIVAVLADQPADQAGIRLYGVAALRPFLAADGLLGRLAASRMARTPRPVRAILFDKTETTNWSLPWHQDRVIAVKNRVDVDGFGPWSRKHGALHVAPPVEVFSEMTTLRLHLDPVPMTNAPLLIAPGSHKMGRISEKAVPAVVGQRGVAVCLAAAGDAWLYSTPILHASEAAKTPSRRRVLQIDYAMEDLPGGLEWLGV